MKNCLYVHCWRAAIAGLVVLTSYVAAANGDGAPTAYQAAVLKSKPVGYWRLGEAMGSIAHDASGHGRHGSYHGKPLLGQPGALLGDKDPSITLKGKPSYVEIPAHADFSQPTSGKGLSIEAWVRPDMLEFEGETKDGGYIHWLGKGEKGQYEWALRFYSRKSARPNRISAYLFNREGGLGAGAYFEDRLTAGEWLHVVACFEPGDADDPKAGVQIYKNGVPRLGPPSLGTLYNNPKWKIKPEAGTAPVRLGTRDSKGFLIGGLDEVAIYPRILSAAEVRDHYDAGRKK